MEVPFAGRFAAMHCSYRVTRPWNVQSPKMKPITILTSLFWCGLVSLSVQTGCFAAHANQLTVSPRILPMQSLFWRRMQPAG